VRVALAHPWIDLDTSVERNAYFLARGLTELGVDVHWYSDPARRAFEPRGVTLHDVQTVSPPVAARLRYPIDRGSFALAATRMLRRERARYDVVDVRQTAAWEHDVVTVHGVTVAMQERWAGEDGRAYRAARLRARLAPVLRPQVGVERLIQRRQFRPGRYTRVIAEAPLVRDDAVARLGVPADLVDVVHPPLDLERFAASGPNGLRSALGVSGDGLLALFVGHAFQRKGLAAAIGAVAAVPSAHLVVVGRGDAETFRGVAARHGALDRVHFVGATAAPERWYGEADVLVFPTQSDNWGAPIIEAMAAGVPVVTTVAAGAAAAVRAADAGIVLADGSPAGVQDAVATLARDEGRRRELGARGRRAAEAFGVRAHAAAVLAVYERVCAERRRVSL
jgi:UDP-glucose:(heptosyl)LPS alpha-1,3-glucosyltransferase